MTDKSTVRIVTVGLALMALLGLAGMIYLAAIEKPVPDAVSNLTSAAVGAVAALLARTSVEPDPIPPPPESNLYGGE